MSLFPAYSAEAAHEEKSSNKAGESIDISNEDFKDNDGVSKPVDSDIPGISSQQPSTLFPAYSELVSGGPSETCKGKNLKYCL